MLDFQSVASEIVRDDPGLVPCQPAIEKELLHFEILRAMHDAGHLRHLMFKGGTCLRLCYGALRFSEDLDFSGGTAFDHRLLADIEGVLRDRIAVRYGLEVAVSPPKLADGKTRTANRWIARVVTRPAGSSHVVGVQRIKIEIDNNEPPSDLARLPIRQRYALLEDYFTPFPIRAAPLSDICSDKMIAFPMSVLTRDNPRHRDVWDMEWMTRRLDDAETLPARASAKAASRGLTGRFKEALTTTINRSGNIIESDGFRNTLQRFVPKPLADRTIGDAEYRQYLASTISGLCRSVLGSIQDDCPHGLGPPVRSKPTIRPKRRRSNDPPDV